MKLYTTIFNQGCFDTNEKVLNKFKVMTDNDFKEKTHLFHGRYENIYFTLENFPEIELIIETALKNAADILKLEKEKLTSGFWLNAMNDGDVTTAHTHDDDDELLSCVYYINVPSNSGDLIITDENKQQIKIKPEAGQFIYFPPNTLHEVSKNKSGQFRLSIAFNFGLKK